MILLKKNPIVFPPKKFRAIPILTHFLLISGNFGSVDFPLPSCLKFPFCGVFKPNSRSSLGCNRGCATKGVKNKRAYHGPLGNAPNWGLGRAKPPRSCRARLGRAGAPTRACTMGSEAAGPAPSNAELAAPEREANWTDWSLEDVMTVLALGHSARPSASPFS